MKLGLENKKETAILGGLVIIAGFLIYHNVLSGPSESPAQPRAAVVAPTANPAPLASASSVPDAAAAASRRPGTGSGSEEFHPVLRPKRPEDRIDPMKMDPTLHLEVLARLQNAGSEGSGRNVFQFGAPPPPPKSAAVSPMRMPEPVVTPQQRSITANVPPGPPPPPPIPLTFYAMVTWRGTGKKQISFKQGDAYFVVGEGDIVMNRYRVARIGVNSVTVEDTQLKREQTLPLAEDADGPR